MNDAEIKEKIDSFPYWRYVFDLKGNLTPSGRLSRERNQWRKEYFFDPVVELCGGSLKGKRVLDLACNAGFWSLCAIESGCDYVLGIDGREVHIEQAEFVFEVKEIDNERYDFVTGDIFATNLSKYGEFDVVLCPGILYHVSKHVELMEKISEVNPDLLVIDTILADIRGSAMRIWQDRSDPKKGSGSVDYELVMTPTQEAVRDLVGQFGYSVRLLRPQFGGDYGVEGWPGPGDYRRNKRRRRAFVCSKKTDLNLLSAEMEPIERRRSPGLGRNARGQEQRAITDRKIERAEALLSQADAALSELVTSRRWSLASTLANAHGLLRRSQKTSSPEERLLEMRGELRAFLQKSERGER